jgi:hypothetical protein
LLHVIPLTSWACRLLHAPLLHHTATAAFCCTRFCRLAVDLPVPFPPILLLLSLLLLLLLLLHHQLLLTCWTKHAISSVACNPPTQCLVQQLHRIMLRTSRHHQSLRTL